MIMVMMMIMMVIRSLMALVVDAVDGYLMVPSVSMMMTAKMVLCGCGNDDCNGDDGDDHHAHDIRCTAHDSPCCYLLS